MRVNELCQKSHSMAKEKGWWNNERSAPEVHMLIVSEIAEATEESRKEFLPPIYYNTEKGILVRDGGMFDTRQGEKILKPEGELVELADAIIRIADYCGHKGWNLEDAIRLKMEYNATRPHRHGGKKF